MVPAVTSVSVFFARERLPTAAKWQAAANEAGFPLRLDVAVDLTILEGVLPAEYAREPTCFDYFLSTDVELPEGVPLDPGGPTLSACVVLVSRSTTEMLAKVAAAAALARLTSGVLYDDAEARAYGPDDAIGWANRIIAESQP
jgi:hypothetical protein